MTSCPKCGFENKAGKFCMKCGSKLFEMTPEVSAQVDILKKRIERDSLNPKLYHELADIYYQNNMMPEALLEYQKVLNLDNSMADVHLKCGDIYTKMKELEKAQASYEKALAVNPDLPEVKIALFNVHRLKSDFDKAIKIGEEILFSQPANIEIHKSLKDIYLRSERYQDAMRELEILLNLAPNDIEVLNELAQRYELHDKNEKAFAIHQKLQALQPGDLKTVFFLGKYFCLSGSYEKSIEYLKHNVAKMSGQMHSSANLYLALCFINQRNLEAATKHIAAVTSLYDEELSVPEKQLYGETYYKIGHALSQQNDLINAIQFLRNATTYDKQNQIYETAHKTAQATLSEVESTKRKRIIRISVLALTVLVFAYLCWYLVHGTIQLEFTAGKNPKLLVDGKPLDNCVTVNPGVLLTPSLFIGEHKITFEQNGFDKWEGTASVSFGRITILKAKLIPAFGSVCIATTPSGADILLDGKNIGTTPFTSDSISTGEYQLTLRHQFCIETFKKIKIRREHNQFEFTLDKGHGTLILIDHWPYVTDYRIDNQVQRIVRDRVTFLVEAGKVDIWYTRYADWKYCGSTTINNGEVKEINVNAVFEK